MPNGPASRGAAWPRQLVAVVGISLLARLAVVLAGPDGETDAYAHLRIAHAVLGDPNNLHVHWVWLPGWHWLVAGLLRLGVSEVGVRLLVACLAMAAPLIVYRWLVIRAPDQALLAAQACALAPVANRLGTTTMPETLFALLLLLVALALGGARGVVAGLLLAGACWLRYEAWGVLPLLVMAAAVRRVSVWTWIPGAVAVVLWLVWRWQVDGDWLVFVGVTRQFTSGLRDAVQLPWLIDSVLLPLLVPWLAFGPALVLLPWGVDRHCASSSPDRLVWLVPAGVLGFVLVAYLGGSAMPLDRYLTPLVPFVSVLLARGAQRVDRARRHAARGSLQVSATRLLLASLALTTLCHFGWVLVVGPDLRLEHNGVDRHPVVGPDVTSGHRAHRGIPLGVCAGCANPQ